MKIENRGVYKCIDPQCSPFLSVTFESDEVVARVFRNMLDVLNVFGPQVYPKGSLVITLVVCLCVCVSVFENLRDFILVFSEILHDIGGQ